MASGLRHAVIGGSRAVTRILIQSADQLRHDGVVKRRPHGDHIVTKRLSILMGVLAGCWLVAGIVGLAHVNGALIGFGLGMAAFFGICSWWLSPWSIRRSARR